MPLQVATCQFPSTADIRANLRWVRRQMRRAHARGADVAHFHETCLSGYAGVDMRSLRGFDWALLQDATAQVMALAAELELWVVLGTTHRLTPPHKPHNSLLIIDSRGRVVERYDKRFCTGTGSAGSGDLCHYSPGSHFSVFRVRGYRCGALICHDFRYDELVREYRRRRVQVLFHSYHNGHASAAKAAVHRDRYRSIVTATMQTYAANNHMWISAANTATRESYWPGFFVRPDGTIAGRLRNNAAGLLLSTVAKSARFDDASAAWRLRALRGVLHSGRLVSDPRSRDRTHP